MERSPPACNDDCGALLQPIFMPLPQAAHKRSRANKPRPPPPSAAGRKSSIYRGVTRHRWSGRYEAHLWDKSSWNSTKSKKGKQGAFDSEEAAGRTYDLAALKYWGPEANLNFPVETYMNELEEMQRLSKEEFLALLRRHSSGFSRGVSKYRGVARHHQNGRWEARIGLVTGSKYLYLGTFGTEEEAATAYDMAALELKGPNAITNFQINAYEHKLKEIGERSSSSQTNPPPLPLNDHQDNSKIRIGGDNVQVERLFTEEEAPPEPESFLLEAVHVDGDDDHHNSLAAGKEWCFPWSLCLDEEPPMSLHHQLKPLHFEFLNDSSFEDEIDFVFGKRVRATAIDQFGNDDDDDDDVLGSGSSTQQQ